MKGEFGRGKNNVNSLRGVLVLGNEEEGCIYYGAREIENWEI